jgi:hypothetical protein
MTTFFSWVIRIGMKMTWRSLETMKENMFGSVLSVWRKRGTARNFLLVPIFGKKNETQSSRFSCIHETLLLKTLLIYLFFSLSNKDM